MTQNPTIDHQIIEQIRQIQPPGDNLVKKIIDLFLAEAERLSHCMEEAVSASDWESVGKHAHSLRSCSANVGAMQVASLSHQLESACRNDQFAEVSDLYTGLNEILESAVTELREVEE